MFDTTVETTMKAASERPLVRPTALLIATDGTPQSNAAISFAKLLPVAAKREVKVLTVVDHAPTPWGTIDRSLVMGYERCLQEEAARRGSCEQGEGTA